MSPAWYQRVLCYWSGHQLDLHRRLGAHDRLERHWSRTRDQDKTRCQRCGSTFYVGFTRNGHRGRR